MSFIPDAFLVHEGVCYAPSVSARANADTVGETPVTRLIEGICAQFPNQSRAILRERIFSKFPLTPACEGMIKVVAKRASVLPEIDYGDAFLKASVDGSRIEVSPAEPRVFDLPNAPASFISETEIANFALSLKPHSDKPVGCVLISLTGKVLAYAWNTNSENRAQHAELNLIRSLQGKGLAKIPPHSTLWVTLKPCAMCAAQILAVAAENLPTVKIIYLEDDPGPKAQNSVLMRGSDLWTKAGEPDIQLAHFQI